MRYKEFLIEKPVSQGPGALGSAIGTLAQKVVNYPSMYIELYKQYRKERLAKEKAKTAREKFAAAKKEAETKKELEKVASKMNPEQQEKTKKVVHSAERQQADAEWKALERKPGRSRALNPTRDWDEYYKNNP
jgi:D-lyxose ketol-isomerase